MYKFFQVAIIIASLAIVGCSSFDDPYVQSGAIGGVTGAAVGAGSGALIGSAISNGDVAASAALGGAIGLPLGIIAGVAVQSYMDDSEIEENVGHMLQAFKLGTPPHGGIALGLDRHVMILVQEESLKEAIAFPMTSRGKTSVMDAPTNISNAQLKELGLQVKKIK